jgi:hypothetical protein
MTTQYMVYEEGCVVQVFHGIPWHPGDVVLTGMAEYGANYIAYLQASDTTDYKLRILNYISIQ